MARAKKKRVATKKARGAKKRKTGQASRSRSSMKKAARSAFRLGGED